jgi:protease-4
MKKRLLLLVVTVALVSSLLGGCGVVGNKVAVISLSGPIQTEAGGLFLGGRVITPELVRQQFERAKEDIGVRAVVLRIQSPGGSVAACQEILEIMESLGKPVVVSFGDVVASGGYYISAKADKIVALPGTLTGSIGVIAQVPNIAGLYDKLGIKVEVFREGKHKDMYAGLRELTPEEKELMQEMTEQLYEQFVRVVAEGRRMDEEKVRQLATGQLYTGEQAKALGLVDELGGLDTAIEVAAQLAGIKQPKVVYYSPTAPSLLRTLLELGGVVLVDLPKIKLLGVEAVVVEKVLSNPYPQPEYR